MKHRNTVNPQLTVQCLAALFALGMVAPAATYAARPNIVLCMADDQGWGDTAYNVTIELYNLQDDPLETNNLVAVHPQRVLAMHKALETWLNSVIDSLHGDDYQ